METEKTLREIFINMMDTLVIQEREAGKYAVLQEIKPKIQAAISEVQTLIDLEAQGCKEYPAVHVDAVMVCLREIMAYMEAIHAEEGSHEHDGA